MVLSEHHGTHIDSSTHYVNNAESLEAGNPAADQRRYMHMLDGGDLSGRIVLVDISARIQAELDKNGGRPSPSVTNFSDDSSVTNFSTLGRRERRAPEPGHERHQLLGRLGQRGHRRRYRRGHRQAVQRHAAALVESLGEPQSDLGIARDFR